MADTLITTVIPTFRRPQLLKRALESVLAQSFTDLRVCVYDNASMDDTENIIRDFARRDSRVVYFKNLENIGAVRNMIQGINAVETPYYSLLSDDDFLLPGFYEKAVNSFVGQPDVGFVCTKTAIVDMINKKMEFRNQDWQAGRHEPSNEMVSKMYRSHFVSTGVLFRKEMRQLIGTFDPSGSDSFYMTMAAGSIPFITLDHYGAAVTMHEQAYSIIGEGITKEEISKLYANLLTSIDTLMKINLPSERKVHVLLLLINSYQQRFDTKRLNYLLSKHDEKQIQDLNRLPSLITNKGLVAKVHGITPTLLRPLLKHVYQLISRLREKRSQKTSRNLSPLPKEAYDLLVSLDTDVAKISSLLVHD